MLPDPNQGNLWLFPFFFVGMWLLVGGLLAELSRWPALARRFRATERPAGAVLRGQVATFGLVSESRITGLIVTPTALYLYSNILFRFRRPALLIPWNEIRYVSTSRFLWMRLHKLSLGKGITSIRITDRAFDAIQPFLSTSPRSHAWAR